MANLTTVTYSAGAIVNTTAGTVSTLDNLIGVAGTPSAQVQSVQGVAGGTAVPVSGTFWQSTQPVSLASIPALAAGTNVIGKVGIDQTTDGTTNAVRLLAETTKVIGTVNVAASQTIAVTQATAASLKGTMLVTDGTNTAAVKAASTAPAATDPALVVAISPNSVNANGQAVMASSAPVAIASNQATLAVAPDTSQIANGASGTMLTPTKVKISVAAATTTTLVALVATKKIRILSMYLVSAAANTVTLQSHTTTANSDGGCSYAANGGISLPFNPIGWFDTTAGEALDMVTSGAGQVSGQLTYVAV